MAKKMNGGENKSQAIRDYYQKHPKAKPMQVAAALKKNGIDVSPAFVSTIRSTSKKKGKVGKPGRPRGSRQQRSATGKQNGMSYESLLKVKEIVVEMGGIQQARAALAALEKLID